MRIESAQITPEITKNYKSKDAVSPQAYEKARILEGPENPSNPRYDNLSVGPITDVVIRAVKDVPFEMERVDFGEAVEAAETYLEERRHEVNAKSRKDNAASFLIGLARRVSNFRGIGFPEENSSATIVEIKRKSVKNENIKELVKQAGPELHEFAVEQIQLVVNIPVDLTDRKGRHLSADEAQRRLGISIGRMLKPEDKMLYKVTRRLDIHNWKKLAQLIREDKISHELVEADEDFVVKPIVLSQIPKEKNSGKLE